ncbi:MAG: response regulator transcription factor [Bacteroidales bacterium]|jgi:DNA-binding NarL/FixJ family response regulator
MTTNKILIADTQIIFFEGIKHILQKNPDIEIIGFATDKQELFQKIKEHKPDLILIDFENVLDFEIENIKEIKSILPDIKILVITASKSKETINKVLKSGIINFIQKDCSIEEFQNALKTTVNGKKYFNEYILGILLNKNNYDSKEDSDVHLTNKEIEIIKLLAQGLTTKDIAQKIFISIHTVNTHRKNILNKLNINNTSELIMYAVRKGIIDTIEYYI